MAQLTVQLSNAAGVGDWRALKTLDGEVAALLGGLGAADALTDEQRAAIEKLRRAHQQAYQRCVREVEDMSVRLAQLREHRNGWIAYAMNDDAVVDERAQSRLHGVRRERPSSDRTRTPVQKMERA
ncbi:MAG TPA: hypothetical protein VK025_09415 [Steroidobacter sp.]|nr:hypothetical protein [Steroidobacter sp.]